jgi:iron complex outermembrane receptor protein
MRGKNQHNLLLDQLLKGFVILTTVAFLFALPVYAKTRDIFDMSLEELMGIEVYGASKFRQKMTEAPAAITVITANEIKKFGYRTLSDILKSVRGFQINYDRAYSFASIRGHSKAGDYTNRVLILVDGHRVRDNIYEGVGLGSDFILDVDLIDRVEIVRGPSASLYGDLAYLGVINIITRDAKSLNGAEVTGLAGSNDTYKERLSYGKTFANGLNMVASATHYRSRGQNLYFKEYDSPSTNYGVAHKCDGDKAVQLFSKLSFQDFILEGAFVSRTKTDPTGAYETVFNSPLTKNRDEWGFMDLKYEREFETGFTVMGRASYNRYSYRGQFAYPGYFNKDLQIGEWWLGEIAGTRTFFDHHKISLGAEYQLNIRQDQDSYDESPYASYAHSRRASRSWGVFGQDEFTIMQGLILNAGIRYDQSSNYGGIANPRIALIYNPFKQSTFKFIYGTAFRAPSAYEMFYETEGWKANPHLKPERIRTYEIVYEQTFSDRYRLSGGVFDYKTSKSIEQVLDPNDDQLVFRNVGGISGRGFEIEAVGNWGQGLHGRASYTYQNVQDSLTKSRLVNSARNLFKFNLITPIWKDILFGGLEIQYTSNRKTMTNTQAGGFSVANFTLFSQKFIKGFEISGSVYNLLDKKYSDPMGSEHLQAAIPQDGRTFWLKVTYGF